MSEMVQGTSGQILIAIRMMITPWKRFALSKCLEFNDCILLFGPRGDGAWNMMTVCGYLVVKEHHRMAI